ncbi:MAG: TRAM domain-containing protein [Clostridiales bacterium]|nr:TRAM domain-containing protein [Clostridiales bacterium]
MIKGSFAVVGAITGISLVKAFAVPESGFPAGLIVPAYIGVSIVCVFLFFQTGSRIIEASVKVLDALDITIQSMTLIELAVSGAGLVAGLIVANLVAIPVIRVAVIGIPLAIVLNIIFGFLGIFLASNKKHDILHDFSRLRLGNHTANSGHPGYPGSSNDGVQGTSAYMKDYSGYKVVDTSAVIDGRLVDICRSGFMEGELIVPMFVLEELRHIADSADALKRNRGRRGLDVLNVIRTELHYPVKIESMELVESEEADSALIRMAKKFKAKIITTDYNLNKVASFQGVGVLNVNELANAVKPITLPGEEMTVRVVKDGRENGQGVAYLEDGTMIVVDGGKTFIGESVNVQVTSVLQTPAGRMIFARLNILLK